MKTFLKLSVKTILYLLLSIVSIIVIMSLFVPSYSFKEPEPFHGDYLHNPYQNMNPSHWQQANFHAHTRQFAGLTNGRVNSNEMLDSVYSMMGFDHVGISDYNKINEYNSSHPSYIPAYEHGYGVFKIHQLCLDAEKVRLIDYFVFQNLSMKQHTLNKLADQCRMAIPAHPSFVKGGYKVDDMKYLSNYKLMEVLNGFRISTAHWDSALSNGHLVYLIANDDSHDVTDVTDIATRFTMINAAENEAEQLLSALENGNAVGVDFPIINDETHQQKQKRLEKNLPYLKQAALKDDTLVISASKPIKEAVFIGQNAKILKTQKNVIQASYIINDDDNYVRTVLKFDDGTSLYLNPITRHENDTIIKQRLDKINYPRTIILWSVYLMIIGSILSRFLKSYKKSKTI
ncbi:MAG: hypothetical protein E7066_04625 [Lentimicrobiaceae bacterium]|nr:hypothetical protein [Lentimicrobiaceae bacterium]